MTYALDMDTDECTALCDVCGKRPVDITIGTSVEDCEYRCGWCDDAISEREAAYARKVQLMHELIRLTGMEVR